VNTPKSYGKSIKSSQLSEGIGMFFPSGDSVGLPVDTLVAILTGIRDEIAEIRQVYASLEMCMVGGSLLIVYEGDRERAAAALQKYEDCDDEEDEDDDEDDDNDDAATKIGPPFTVKLIDFAHTTFVPGQGPDESVLLGMDNVIKLLDGRLEELKTA
jgi:1D-myo-inositol-tetrakisphosphate 5-kinase/inositol-polyphosphate multikinase